MKKVLVIGPLLTRSGYGEHARFVVDSLLSKPELYDVYIHPLSWGKSSWSYDHDYKRQMYEFLIQKKESYNGEYDFSLQITIPNEFVHAAPINIGVTAGVETTTVPREWIMRSNSMDKLIVTSQFTKSSFDDTEYEVEAQMNDEIQKFKGVAKPIEVVTYPIKDEEGKIDSEKLSCVTTDFNFLTIAQMAPRKNLEQTIACFVDEFRDNENVGLIIKSHAQNHSIMDRDLTERALFPSVQRLGERKCKIYHIHGDMDECEIQGLIRHPKVNAYCTTTFSEGFGLPLFDAAAAGVPIVAPKFSGYLDFLHIPKKNNKGKITKDFCFEPIKVEIKEIPPHAVMPDILLEGSKWGYPDYDKTKKALKNVYTKYVAKKKIAENLQSYVLEEFSRDRQLERMCEAIRTGYENETVDWNNKMSEVKVL